MVKLDELFRCKVSQYQKSIVEVLNSLQKYKFSYSFLNNEIYNGLVTKEILDANHTYTNQIYWSELLQRVHLCSTTSLIRNYRWLQGVDNAVECNNFLAFAGSLRGFLIACGDTHQSLGTIAQALSNNYRVIRLSVQNKLVESIVISEELENGLLHFSEAKRGGEITPKPDTNYINIELILRDKSLQNLINDCYKELCQITHPASSSIYAYLKQSKYDNNVLLLDINADKLRINEFCEKYQQIFIELFYAGFNSALINLEVLNQFPIKKLHTEMTISLDKIKLSRDVKDIINNTVNLMKKQKEFT